MAAGSKKVIYAALVGNGLISITKFVAAGITGSSAMLSEGIHSVVDTGNQVLLLHGLRRSQRPADRRHPFGHGKEVYFWSFVVALLIFAVGAGVSIYEGIVHVLHAEPVQNPTINYVVLGCAIVFEGFAWYFAFREFRKSKGSRGYFSAVRHGKDPTLFVVLFEDSAALAGLLVAGCGLALGQVTGIQEFDGIASIVIGLILGATAIWLAIETKGLLIGESASAEVVGRVSEIATAHGEVETVNHVLTLHMGPTYVLANVSIDFRDETDVGTLERAIAEITSEIREAYPEIQRVFIEAEKRPKISSGGPGASEAAPD